MSTILSIDPGGVTTGVVLVGYDAVTPAHLLTSWAVQGGVEPLRGWVDSTVEWLGGTYDGEGFTRDQTKIRYYDFYPNSKTPRWNNDDINIVICEKFVPRNIPGADYSPLVLEGVVQWIWPSVIWSPASGKDKAVPDEILKRLGMYEFSGDHHHDRREASRHAIRWLKAQGHVPTLKVGWAPNAR